MNDLVLQRYLAVGAIIFVIGLIGFLIYQSATDGWNQAPAQVTRPGREAPG